jgi:hypothetical protein
MDARRVAGLRALAAEVANLVGIDGASLFDRWSGQLRAANRQ